MYGDDEGMFWDKKTGEPVVNTGHTRSPGAFGLPVLAKFVHAATSWSERLLSLAFSSVVARRLGLN